MPYKDPEAKKAHRKKYYQANKDKIREHAKEYRRKNPEKSREGARRYRKKYPKRANKSASTYYYTNKDKCRNWQLKNIYGITLDQYTELLTKQNGVCAICCNPETVIVNDSNIKALAVDHDHETMKIRGLLCNACNRGIGYLRDSPAILIAAAKYLAEHI